MTERSTNNVWNDEGGQRVAKKKKGGGARHFLLFFLILLLVLGIAAVSAYRDGSGFDVLRRFFAYGGADAQDAAEYRYESAPSNRFADLDGVLALASETSLRLLAPDGSEIWSAQVKMTTPEIRCGGDYAVAYDVGGKELFVLDKRGEVFHFTSEEPILHASLNRKGMLAVTAEKKNCKGCVSVYDAKQQKVFEFQSSRRFVTQACVSENGKYLAAVTLGQEDGAFISDIVLYDLKKTEPIGSFAAADALCVDLDGEDGVVTVVSDTALSVGSFTGELTASYDYAQEYLRDYDFGGDGFTLLLLNRYRSGSVGRLVTLDRSGEELASLEVSDEVRGVSACGKYLAVLYADALTVYTRDLQVYATLHGVEGARGVLARQDGSALILGSDRATLFLP